MATPIPIPIRCRCGTLQGEVEPRDVFARATCFCRDCQAFARALDREDVLDPKGGTDILAMLPAGLRLTAGSAQLACLSLGPRGLLRWYAACCHTPIANTPRDPKLPYAGVLASCAAGGIEALDATFGPVRAALHARSATGPVKATPLLAGIGVARIMWGMLRARLQGRHRATPFFDAAGTRRPVAQPRVLTREERARASEPRRD